MTDTGTPAVTTGSVSAPATFAEAFAADASSASTPSTDTTTDSASASATETPVAPDQVNEGLPQQGEPPKERWESILANARQKATEEATSALEKELGWARTVDRAAIEQAQKIGQLYTTNRGEFIRQVLVDAVSDPAIAPMVRSEAGRLLAQARGQQAQAPELPPMVNVQLEDGSVVNLPRDPQAWLNYHRAQWQADLDKKFQPTIETVQQFKAAQEQYARVQEANKFATTFVADLQKLPQFAEHKQEIYDRLSKMSIEGGREAVEAATLRLYNEVVLPKLAQTTQAKAESQLLDNLQKKAAASTGINPSSAAVASQKKVTSFHQLTADDWK